MFDCNGNDCYVEKLCLHFGSYTCLAPCSSIRHVWEFLYMFLYEWNVWSNFQWLIWLCNAYDEAVSSESATQSSPEKNALHTFPSAFEVSIFPRELFCSIFRSNSQSLLLLISCISLLLLSIFFYSYFI